MSTWFLDSELLTCLNLILYSLELKMDCMVFEVPTKNLSFIKRKKHILLENNRV